MVCDRILANLCLFYPVSLFLYLLVAAAYYVRHAYKHRHESLKATIRTKGTILRPSLAISYGVQSIYLLINALVNDGWTCSEPLIIGSFSCTYLFHLMARISNADDLGRKTLRGSWAIVLLFEVTILATVLIKQGFFSGLRMGFPLFRVGLLCIEIAIYLSELFTQCVGRFASNRDSDEERQGLLPGAPPSRRRGGRGGRSGRGGRGARRENSSDTVVSGDTVQDSATGQHVSLFFCLTEFLRLLELSLDPLRRCALNRWDLVGLLGTINTYIQALSVLAISGHVAGYLNLPFVAIAAAGLYCSGGFLVTCFSARRGMKEHDMMEAESRTRLESTIAHASPGQGTASSHQKGLTTRLAIASAALSSMAQLRAEAFPAALELLISSAVLGFLFDPAQCLVVVVPAILIVDLTITKTMRSVNYRNNFRDVKQDEQAGSPKGSSSMIMPAAFYLSIALAMNLNHVVDQGAFWGNLGMLVFAWASLGRRMNCIVAHWTDFIERFDEVHEYCNIYQQQSSSQNPAHPIHGTGADLARTPPRERDPAFSRDCQPQGEISPRRQLNPVAREFHPGVGTFAHKG